MRQYHRRDVVGWSSRIRNQLQRVDNICRAIFSPMQMRSNHFSQRRSMARVCVQSLGASIFQLINFIFTHLFLNVLSDGNAAGCSSEVLTRQMGLKGEVSQCQRQDFNSNLRDPFSFYYSWKVRIISAKSAEHTWSPTVLLIQYKKKHFNSSFLLKGKLALFFRQGRIIPVFFSFGF